MEKHYDHFTHKECEFFPCHPGADEKDFNCLFCYCPLYTLGDRCGGDFVWLENGVKDCSACLYPHKRENYEAVCARYREILKEVRRPRVITTTLCHLERGGRYLMMHRVKKKNDVNHDKWVGIGGKVEEGESPEECVMREVLEETGLTMHSFRFRGIMTFISSEYDQEIIYLYDSDDYSGTLRECDEGTLEWIPKEDVFSLPIWEGDKTMFRYLNEHPDFFSLKLRYEGDELKELTEEYPVRRSLL